jgi:hypothetical protein
MHFDDNQNPVPVTDFDFNEVEDDSQPTRADVGADFVGGVIATLRFLTTEGAGVVDAGRRTLLLAAALKVRPRTVRELAHETGIPPTTAHRLMAGLEHGVIQMANDSKLFGNEMEQDTD